MNLKPFSVFCIELIEIGIIIDCMAIYWCSVTTTFGGNEQPSMVRHSNRPPYMRGRLITPSLVAYIIWDNENPPMTTACMHAL